MGMEPGRPLDLLAVVGFIYSESQMYAKQFFDRPYLLQKTIYFG
jgi:hypothetical protein